MRAAVCLARRAPLASIAPAVPSRAFATGAALVANRQSVLAAPAAAISAPRCRHTRTTLPFSSIALPARRAMSSNSSATAAAASPKSKAKIAVVYYSMYGHIATMAKEVAKGVEAGGAEVKVFQVSETLSDEVLKLMHAPTKDSSVPVLSDPTQLAEFDGIIFGTGTRFGMMTAQLKAFWDKTGGIWAKGGWVGKTAGTFFSTGTQGGGQETTALTMLTQFTHHGMVYVPIGYSENSLANMDEIHGGSSYGAGTLAGSDGSRQPTELEKRVARHQGKHIATITGALKRGKETQ